MIEKATVTKDMGQPIPKKEFHFPGGGTYFPMTILAAVREEAEKIWLATRRLVGQPEEKKVEDITNNNNK